MYKTDSLSQVCSRCPSLIPLSTSNRYEARPQTGIPLHNLGFLLVLLGGELHLNLQVRFRMLRPTGTDDATQLRESNLREANRLKKIETASRQILVRSF